jgi:hypothetical protein
MSIEMVQCCRLIVVLTCATCEPCKGACKIDLCCFCHSILGHVSIASHSCFTAQHKGVTPACGYGNVFRGQQSMCT